MVRTEFNPILDSAKWDWYQATITEESLFYVKPFLDKNFPNADWRPATPKNGYHFAEGLYISDRCVLLACYGGNQSTCNLISTSYDAPALYDALRSWGGAFKPTRFDSCIDWEEKHLFDTLAASLVEFATDKDLVINHQGDWSRGRSRTLYIGSKSSPVQLRLYEKGYEVQGLDTTRPDWVRLEVQVRPAKKRRAVASTWTPADAFCCGWVSDAVQRFFILPQCKYPVGFEKTDNDRLKRKQWLFKVGSRALRELLEDHCGDSESFAAEIINNIALSCE